MPDIPLPEDLSTYVRDLESRIRALETAPRAQDMSLPWKYGYVSTGQYGSSTTYGDLATVDPLVSVNVGQSHRVFVSASAYLYVPTNTTGTVGLFIDGYEYTEMLAFSNSTAATMASDVATNRVLTSTVWIPPGTHTFQLKYKTSLSPVLFGNRFLSIQPF